VIDKRTVFVLGAGASCPYGYPSGARLREMICLDKGFWDSYVGYRDRQNLGNKKSEEINRFRKIFKDSGIRSIDVFMANNPNLAQIGKYIITYEIFRAERQSLFDEEAKLAQESIKRRRDNSGSFDLLSTALFEGGDWYFYLYNKLIEGLVGPTSLPDFSSGNLAFITFNYDRSLEYYFYERLRNSYTGVTESDIAKCLGNFKILHVYGRVAPLKWQDPKYGVEYRLEINESLLQNSSSNIRTIYEEKENPELIEAQNLLKQAERIFFLGFRYAKENMEVLGLPAIISPLKCWVFGTAFGMYEIEINRIRNQFIKGVQFEKLDSSKEKRILIKNADCLDLLRNYLH
jgi:hypothetical protein